jgi:hypothetical protein
MANLLVENGLALSGTTAQRPTNAAQGQRYYDESLGTMLIYQDGTASGSPTAGWVPVSGVVAEQITFTETSGAGTYTGSLSLVAGASVLDIIIDGVALWNASSTVSMDVGDTGDADGFFSAINLKATDLLAGESLSFSLAGGKAGAYLANSQCSPRYSASARTITGTITAAGTGGTTGRTRMTVIYALPRVKAATKA